MLITDFEMTDSGLMHYCLVIEVFQEPSKIFISQRKYPWDISKAFGMIECNIMVSPVEFNVKLTSEDASPLVDACRYRELVGSLIYLCNTRIDIDYAIGVLSRFSNQP